MSNHPYTPRIDEDLLHILWLKSRVECRPLTKVLNRILREKLEREDVAKQEAQINEQCIHCGMVHGRKLSDGRKRASQAAVHGDPIRNSLQVVWHDGGGGQVADPR